MIKITKEQFRISEILRYLGYPEDYSDNNVIQEISNAIDECILKAHPRITYKIFDPIFNKENNKIVLDNSNIELNGNAIFKHMNDASKIVCFAATLGVQIENYIKLLSFKEITKSIIFDSVCNECIEVVCDLGEIQIKQDDHLKNLFSNSRFSPGYGDLPIEIQPNIIKVLDANRKIGLTCSQTNLLIPRKSVTAFIGYFNNEVNNLETTCEFCNIKDKCKLRKEGKYCGYKKNN